jgi:Spy/CpxP family protein refolding chaperone
MNSHIRTLLLMMLGAASAMAQQVPKALEQGTSKNVIINTGRGTFSLGVGIGLGIGGRSGRWWTRPEVIEQLGLSADQRKNLDDILQQHRLKLIDLDAALQREEVTLEPLVSAQPPDDAKVTAQIDRVAQARAELEKANSRMLWQARRVLTPEQWTQLQSRPVTPKPLKLK